MRLFNTLTRKLEDFRPISGKTVKIYTCGPTVYSSPHIGNFTAYIYWDLLVRALTLEGYVVKRILNYTDVGHLTSDADSGEDKLEKGARREGKTVWEVAEYYIREFERDFDRLNLTKPTIVARATDYIEADEHAVDKMTENGFTYETSDGIYYNTKKFTDYPKFARLDLNGQWAGARVAVNSEKKNPSDFAVWKFIQPGENHAMRWDYLGRPGYPGWHLECATIIHENFGEPIDIHTGGIDHIPVHHTNEIAEMYAMTGKPLANYWVHCNFITINGEKISKSLGNIITLDELEKKGYSALDYKMWVLQGHYQGERNFTLEGLEAAKNRRLAWRNRIAELYQTENSSRTEESVDLDNLVVADRPLGPAKKDTASETSENFQRILAPTLNNLTSSESCAIIDSLMLTLDDWQKIDELFGLNLIGSAPDLSAKVKPLLEERKKARAEKKFARADEIRDKLKSQNIAIKDTPNGPIWQYLS